MNLRKLLDEHIKIFNLHEQQQLTEFLTTFTEDEPGVSIVLTDEIGELKWVVHFTEWDDFWLESFDSKKEAIDFCKKYELCITDINEEFIQ